MDPVRITCPHCGKSLKVTNPKLLGKKVKCPSCSQPVTLVVPESEEELVEFEMASAPATEPATGTAGRWVPDDAPPLPAVDIGSAPTAAATMESPGPIVTDSPSGPIIGDRNAGGVSRLKELRRKNRQRRNVGVIVGVVTALGVGGAWYGISSYLAGKRAEEAAVKQAEADAKAPKRDRAYESSKEAQKFNLEIAARHDPTRGEPIDLRFLPDGASIVFHLRPAEFTSSNAGREVLAGIDPVWQWAKGHIDESVGEFPLEQVEELTMCVYLLSREKPPMVSSVVRFTGPLPKGELLNGGFFKDKLKDVPEIWSNDSGDWAYMLQDENKTLAICPNEPDYVEEMANATGVTQSVPAAGVKEIVRFTDRARHFTIAFRPTDLVVFRDQLFDDLAKPAADVLARWFGDDIDGLAWSLHVTDQFHSEMIMQPRRATATDRLLSANRLQKDFRERFDELPRQVYTMVRYMEPETVGRRTIVGRFPAMTKAFAVGTLGGSDDDHVRMTTIIDNDRAAPNLAVGALLTWYESTRTDFDRTLEPTPTDTGPVLVADRLKATIVEAEFGGVAMDEIYAYISDEAKVEIYLDGDALKDAGFTKVMRQTMSLGNVRAIDAIKDIVKRYDEPNKKMALVIDEVSKRAIITTEKFAKQQGRTIYAFD